MHIILPCADLRFGFPMISSLTAQSRTAQSMSSYPLSAQGHSEEVSAALHLLMLSRVALAAAKPVPLRWLAATCSLKRSLSNASPAKERTVRMALR